MKKGKGFMKGVGKMSSEEIAAGKESAPPDVLKMYEEGYRGKTQLKKEDGRRNVPIIEDKLIDPYKGVRSTKKHQESSLKGGNPLNVEVNFDRKAYQARDKEE